MPDLPLPKPSSPPSPIGGAVDAAMSGVAISPPTASPAPLTPSISSSQPLTSPPSPPVSLSPTDSSSPQTSFSPPSVEPSSFPKPDGGVRPPAVVTALSSIGSNNLPSQISEVTPTSSDEVNREGVVEQAEMKLTPPPSNLVTPDQASNGGFTPPPASKPTDTPLVSPPSAPTHQAPPPPETKLAQPKKSPFRFLPLILGLVLLLGVVGFVLLKFLGGGGSSSNSASSNSAQSNTNQGDAAGPAQPSVEPIVLEYWGLWEPNEVMEKVLAEFESKNPGVTVSYIKQNHRDYRERLQTAIASRSGPDLFRFHASWAPMLIQELAPMPTSVLTQSDFESAFFPVASQQLIVNGSVVGLPTMYDGLMLFYNKDIFQTAGLEPPKTWAELRTVANTLTIRSGDQLERGGVALGSATNVEHFSDILALLMLQNGADLSDPTSVEVRDALLFYTNFVKRDGVWDQNMPSSTIAFARGDVAMMIAPSWRALEVAAINPNLAFATAPAPQLSDNHLAWANYWVEGVNQFGKHQEQAWNLAKFLSSAAGQKALFAAQAEARGFGTAYSRVDLADQLAEHPILAPLMIDAPRATSGFMNSYTHDNGINDQVIKYYENGISAILAGGSIPEVQTTIAQGVAQVMQQYGLGSGSVESISSE